MVDQLVQDIIINSKVPTADEQSLLSEIKEDRWYDAAGERIFDVEFIKKYGFESLFTELTLYGVVRVHVWNVKPIRIAFNGDAGVGKSTATKFVEKLGAVRLAFAKPLKDGCNAFFGFDAGVLDDPELKETMSMYGATYRKILQKVGTELMREALHAAIPELKLPYGKTLWCHRMVMNMKKYPKSSIAIEDLRFPDESECMEENKILRVKIERGSPKPVKHASEMGCKVDMVIKNDSSHEELYLKLAEIIKNSVGVSQ